VREIHDFAALLLKLEAVEAHRSTLDCRTGLSSGTMQMPPRFADRRAVYGCQRKLIGR
jgi:hypothetical protein